MRKAGALLLLLCPAFAACGGGSAFPERAVCPAPTPLAAATGRQATTQYLASVRAGVDRLAGLRETLRSAYPGEKFSRVSQFRVDFARLLGCGRLGPAALNLLAMKQIVEIHWPLPAC